MALLDNSIGPFEFLALHGQRIPPYAQLGVDGRPGVNGHEITRTSLKGTPFQLISQVDTATYEEAWGLYLQYLDTIEGDPLELTQGGISSLAERNYLVQVLQVVPLRVIPIRGAVGRKLGEQPNEGWCECAWTLLSLPQLGPPPA